MSPQDFIEVAESLKTLVALNKKLTASVKGADKLDDKDRIIALELTAWEIALIVGFLSQALNRLEGA